MFLPVIQRQLDLFKEGWGHHSLRTEHNRTPLQLFVLGLSHMHSESPGAAPVTGLCDVSLFVGFAHRALTICLFLL